MKIMREIEEDIEINWEKIYQTVKKDYDEWIQHNIDNNVNPLNCSFDYDELEELSESFGTNVEHYMEEYDDRDIYPDFIANTYVNEFIDFLKKMKGNYGTGNC